MRKLLSVIAGAGLLVTMSACAAQPPVGFAGCDTGSSAALVKVDGEVGSATTVTFPTPLVPKSSENAVLIPGDGDRVEATDAANVTVSVYLADTGETLIEPTVITSFVDGRLPFMSGLTCASDGGRVAMTGTIEDLFADGLTGQGIDPTDNVVVVADVNDAFPGRATGADRAPQAGFPAIVIAPNGQPGFTVPATDAPTALGIETLKEGSGATVDEGDSVYINLTGLVWGGTKTFFSSFDVGSPTPVVAADIATTKGGVPPGLAKALIGQKVGSQVVVVAPPKDGYPSGTAPEGVTEDSTVIFVVDILKID
ncbi:MAG: FKBP-type peptidyl-prolyl cis-trans isomerase [Rhodoglobus sp.]